MCAKQIHSGDTRNYVSVGELATPTMPMGKIRILISVVTASQDRDGVTICLEASVLTTALQKKFYYIVVKHILNHDVCVIKLSSVDHYQQQFLTINLIICLQKILPEDTMYKVCKWSVVGQDQFITEIRMPMTDPKDVESWVKDLECKTKTTFRIKRTFPVVAASGETVGRTCQKNLYKVSFKIIV